MANHLELQGHRGARGLRPENTLVSFEQALAFGMTGVELDVAITRDGVVVVTHDSRLHGDIVRRPDGEWISPDEERAILELSLKELRALDVGRLKPGSKYARRFPDQQPADGARIPTLEEVIELVRTSGNEHFTFAVEIKSDPQKPELTVDPESFARAVVDVLRKTNVVERSSILSFNWHTLAHVQQIAPEVTTVYLTAQQRWLDNVQRGRTGISAWTAGLDVDEYAGSVPRLIKAAGGSVWSVLHHDIDAAALEEAHALGLRVLTWTVNNPADMKRLIELGVDGIVTDYPDRLRKVVLARGMEAPERTTDAGLQ